MPQIFDVTANENSRYKGNELESALYALCIPDVPDIMLIKQNRHHSHIQGHFEVSIGNVIKNL